MNPNLRIFFKRLVYVLVFAGLVVILFLGLQNVVTINWSAIGSYLMYGLMGLMMTVMGGLILGLVVRVVWTGIMNRTDTIEMFCEDKVQDGFHIVGSHYNPGGESTDGFSSYFHYYINDNGKLFLSKRVEKDGADLTKSLLHLSEQTRLRLDPAVDHGNRIGTYSTDDKGIEVEIRVRKGKLHFRGYEGLIDYGFRITYTISDLVKWRVKI